VVSVDEFSEQKRSDSWRYAVQFAIQGDVRFLSHHDTMRMFERAATRAGLPLRYSEGFNPNPKLMLPLPRPVGVAGLEEWMLLQLREPIEPAAVCGNLAEHVPEGVRLAGCRWTPGSASWQAKDALYEVPLDGDLAALLPERIARVMAAASGVLTRRMGPGRPAKSIDARRFVLGLDLLDQRLAMRVSFESGATARPSEVLELLGLPVQPYVSRVTRVHVTWGPRDLSDKPVLTSQSRPSQGGRIE
jgi:radical SAM-linked protein